MERNQTVVLFFRVVGTLLIVWLVYGAFSAWRLNRASQKSIDMALMDAEALSLDPEVSHAIDSMDSTLADLSNFVFDLTGDNDPLRLSRVIMNFEEAKRKRFQEMDEDYMLRLSATVYDSINPMAIIKYLGRSYILRIGDTLDGKYEVLDVEKKTALLVAEDGKRIFLETRPMVEEEEEVLKELQYNYPETEGDFSEAPVAEGMGSLAF